MEAANRWHQTFEIASFVALGLLAAFSVLAYIYGGRKDALVVVADEIAATQHEQEERKSKGEVASANHRASEAQAEAEQLKKRAAPRLLTQAEEHRMMAFLEGKPIGVFAIKVDVSAADAQNYGQQIANLFRSAGWTVRVDEAIFNGPDIRGLWITAKDVNAARNGAGLLQHAFRAAGIRVRGEYDPTMPEEIWLSIGAK